MTTVNDVLTYLDTLAPKSMKMEWDNVGLLCGYRNREVHKILVALDPFESVCREAHSVGADLIVTHHPLIFQPQHAITDDTGVGRSILFLASHSISAINAHTNLDCAPGGVNDCLAAALGLSDVSVICPAGTDEAGRPWGLLRKGIVQQQTMESFLAHVKGALGCSGLRYVSSGVPVKCVAVGGGACASELQNAIRAGCDTMVTADVKYNQFWDAQELGINLIDAGHFFTENPVCDYLTNMLKAAFPDICVEISREHTDCAKFF